jgi:signal transduction histidine kinase
MTKPEKNEERVLVLTPTGRDAPATCAFLEKAGFAAKACELGEVVRELESGVGVVLIAEEALLGQDVEPLVAWIADQPPWSDLLFLMLTSDREAPSIATAREQLMAGLQNVSLIERPVQPITLLSAVRSALRGRRHQYEVRAYLSERQEAEGKLERLVAERTRALAGSNEQLVAEMTERARAEEALRQSQKLEAIGQLTGGVAHDFNNLLTVISSSVDFLRRPDLPEHRRKRYLEAIRETTDRAAALTSQLLAFARRQPLKAEVFDAIVAVRRTIEMLRTIVGARIEVRLELADEACFMHADKSQFETALVNMAVNARDAMNGQGQLTIAVKEDKEIPAIRSHPKRTGTFVAVAVTDTGTGIAPDRIGQIFEPFYTTKEVGKGTGLGLSQVYGFAKQSGGEVVVESALGQGTTFTLYLRRVETGAAATHDPTPRESEDLGPTCGRILVVEDNSQVGEFAVQLLVDFGYTTTLALEAQSALALIEADPTAFDLVFSDVIMPGTLTGVDLAVEIRRRWPELPLVLTTGYSNVLAEGGGEGFDVLRKPYSVETLSNLIRNVLGRKDRIAAGARS